MIYLHDDTALERLEQLGQLLLDQLLDFVVLVLVLVLVLAAVLLLLATVMLLRLSTVVLLAAMMLLSTTIRRGLRRRRHLPDLAALQIDKDPALILLGLVVQAELPANLLDARLDLLHVSRAVVPLADNDV